mmetsp:Transcript_37453/g.120382  ORF Transcript_37453/g.120382 Transcript_37453/m.120382 type:complete len:210 (-) Transcript_37453:901-1530(-)
MPSATLAFAPLACRLGCCVQQWRASSAAEATRALLFEPPPTLPSSTRSSIPSSSSSRPVGPGGVWAVPRPPRSSRRVSHSSHYSALCSRGSGWGRPAWGLHSGRQPPRSEQIRRRPLSALRRKPEARNGQQEARLGWRRSPHRPQTPMRARQCRRPTWSPRSVTVGHGCGCTGGMQQKRADPVGQRKVRKGRRTRSGPSLQHCYALLAC